MSYSTMTARRRRLAFLGFVLTVAIVLYVGIAALVTRGGSGEVRPGLDGFGTYALVAGFACLAGALFLAPRERAAGFGTPLPTPAAVHARAFLALVVSEAGAICGLVGTFATRELRIVLLLAAGAIAVDLLWILPEALRLMEAAERGQSPEGATPA
jgi:hypothetical protein